MLVGAMVALLARSWGDPDKHPAGGKRTLALLAVAFLAVLGGRQVRIWRNTDTLFDYIERQPAFVWNVSQQAYIYQLWAAHAQADGRADAARARNDQARRALLGGVITAVEKGAWVEAIDCSRQLEQSFGLPPQLRRERARWLLTLRRLAEAAADLERAAREMPDDVETKDLTEEWRRQGGPSPNGNHL